MGGIAQAIAEAIKAVMEALKVMAQSATGMINEYEDSNEQRFKNHQNQRWGDTLILIALIVCAAILIKYFSKQK